jgi:hypothetical protein
MDPVKREIMDSKRIRDATIELMARDHVEDVNRLDKILGKQDSATLSNLVPPNPYVGNPNKLIPGECVALIGINPKLDLDRPGFKHFEANIPLSCQTKFEETNDSTAFDPWFEKLHRYYDNQYFVMEDGKKIDPYYGRYFTKLGNHIGRAWYDIHPPDKGSKQPNARTVLGSHVLKLDAVPYYSFSDEMDGVNLKESMQYDPAMRVHKQLIDCLFDECKPRHLQVNGKGTAGEMIKAVFGEDGSFEKIGKGTSSIEVGWGTIGHHKLPILIHGFTNTSGGPQSPEAFLECANHFEKWLGNQEVTRL